MEVLLDDILSKIHNQNYAEGKQIASELERFVLGEDLSDAQIYDNVFAYLEKSYIDKERDNTNLRKELFKIVAQYIKKRKEKLHDYIDQIRDSCLRLFKKEVSNTVKEASLQPIKQLLKVFPAEVLGPRFQVKGLFQLLWDDLKFGKPLATTKGTIWNIIGLIVKKFPHEDEKLAEIQKSLLHNLKEQFDSKKPGELLNEI